MHLTWFTFVEFTRLCLRNLRRNRRDRVSLSRLKWSNLEHTTPRSSNESVADHEAETDWFPHPRLRLTLWFIRLFRSVRVSRRWRSGAFAGQKIKFGRYLHFCPVRVRRDSSSGASQSRHTIHIRNYFRSHVTASTTNPSVYKRQQRASVNNSVVYFPS